MRTAIDGLVLRELPSGENDKLLLILTAKEGKLWVTAKGGRSIKGKKSAICKELFAYRAVLCVFGLLSRCSDLFLFINESVLEAMDIIEKY